MAALVAQQADLAGLLGGLTADDWCRPTRCPGWDVADVVLHLIQTDAMAVDSVHGNFGPVTADPFNDSGLPATIDAGAAQMVEEGRGQAPDELLRRWSAGASRLAGALDGMDLSTRLVWVAGPLSARTLATTRLAETWIHSGDVASAVGTEPADTDRLRHVARLAWRTLPYAFASAGRTMAGPVAFRLTSPDGRPWVFEPDEPAVTVITGPGAELCAVAARRRDVTTTSLRAEGPDGGPVLDLVRTCAL